MHNMAQKETPHEVMIADIALDEFRLGRHRPAKSRRQIVDNKNVLAGIEQLEHIWLPMKPAPPVTSTLIDDPRGTAVAFRRLLSETGYF
jgi:hypothetical protein